MGKRKKYQQRHRIGLKNIPWSLLHFLFFKHCIHLSLLVPLFIQCVYQQLLSLLFLLIFLANINIGVLSCQYQKTHSDKLNSFFLFFFFLFRAALAAYVSSQARGQIGAASAGLHHSHSNTRSKHQLQPATQLTAMPDPSPAEQGQGLNLHPYGY